MVVQHETEFFNRLLLKQVSFVQNTYRFLFLDAANNLKFSLQLTFGISAVESCLKSQLVQHAFVKPPGR